MKKQIKGQAALEFLTTYGWAFLVILIMIGAMAYFGFLKPSRLLPESCLFAAGFDCPSFQISLTGGVAGTNDLNFDLKNKITKQIVIAAGAIDVTTTANVDVLCSNAAQITIDPDVTQMVDLTGCDFTAVGTISAPTKGDKVKFVVTVPYKPTGGNYVQAMSGEIYGTVQ